jgi:hypothetical protein
MSQTETVKRSRLHAAKERADAFLKTFEWDWTKAVLFSLGLTFFIVITTSVIPSFWLYFASTQLKMDGGSDVTIWFITIPAFWAKELRDAVAMGLVTGPIITILVVASIMQNWRRKLRGASSDARPTGGYR